MIDTYNNILKISLYSLITSIIVLGASIVYGTVNNVYNISEKISSFNISKYIPKLDSFETLLHNTSIGINLIILVYIAINIVFIAITLGSNLIINLVFNMINIKNKIIFSILFIIVNIPIIIVSIKVLLLLIHIMISFQQIAKYLVHLVLIHSIPIISLIIQTIIVLKRYIHINKDMT